MKVRLLALPIFALSVLLAQVSYSHGDHAPPPPAINEDAALKAASSEVANFIKQGQTIKGEPLDQSWANLTPKLSKKSDGYYVVSLENPAEKKTLYVLLADYGKLYDANFSGKFEGVE